MLEGEVCTNCENVQTRQGGGEGKGGEGDKR